MNGSARRPFVIAYSYGTIDDFRNLPSTVNVDAANVITKLADGIMQGAPMSAPLDEDLAGVHRVALGAHGALHYKFHRTSLRASELPTAHVLAVGRDDQDLRSRTRGRLRPIEGRLWTLAYSRDFLTKDLPRLEAHPELRDAMRDTIRTLTSPDPPRTHDPLSTEREINLPTNPVQTIRQVRFDSAERVAAGAEPRGVVTYRVLPPSKAKGNTLLIVQAAPISPSSHQEMSDRLRLWSRQEQLLNAYRAELHLGADGTPLNDEQLDRGSAARLTSTTGAVPQRSSSTIARPARSGGPAQSNSETPRHHR